jgi:SAM-dependent methyltransferase
MTKPRVFASFAIALLLGCTKSEPPPTSPAPLSADPQLQPASSPPAAPSQAPNTPPAGPAPASSAPAAAPSQARETPAASSADQSSRAPDVVYVPTPQSVVDKMLELAQVKKTDVVYDLGCGDGRIVVTAAKKYGTKAYGYDIDPKRVQEALENVKKNKVENLVTIEQKDIFTLDLSPANVVTLYLLPDLNVKLIPQLEKLKPGSRIVSHDFDMKGVKPVKHLAFKTAGLDRAHDIYLWHVPLQKETKTGLDALKP